MRQFKQARRATDNRQVNSSIIYRELRVIGEQGQLGVMSKDEALRLAEKQNTDLVVINASAKPTLCR